MAAVRADRHGLVWMTGILAFSTWVLAYGATLGRALTVAAWAAGLVLLAEFAVFARRGIAEMMAEEGRLDRERKRRQATEERLRIAHELHDVLGHHLSLINVRAAVGRHLMDRQPEEARVALDTIKLASAEALREVGLVLDTLYPSGEAAPRAPAPRLDRLGDLTTDAGLPVRTTVTGEPRPLPAEIDRAAYRIVQEALTNVRRHAGFGASAVIVIEYRPEEMVVQIDDDGGLRGPAAVDAAPAPEGNGISGMRERTTALGGSLSAQLLPDGGWRIRALLPLPAADPDSASTSDGAP
jgi:signal transduction histidine kinase